MTNNYKPYDPNKVSVILGVIPARGFADGEMINVEFAEDDNTTYIGTDGDGRHIQSQNKSGTVTVRLHDYSETNPLLVVMNSIGEAFPITIVDKSSNADLFFAASCKVKKTPNFTKGKEGVTNEWVFNFINGKIIHSGGKKV